MKVRVRLTKSNTGLLYVEDRGKQFKFSTSDGNGHVLNTMLHECDELTVEGDLNILPHHTMEFLQSQPAILNRFVSWLNGLKARSS